MYTKKKKHTLTKSIGRIIYQLCLNSCYHQKKKKYVSHLCKCNFLKKYLFVCVLCVGGWKYFITGKAGRRDFLDSQAGKWP